MTKPYSEGFKRTRVQRRTGKEGISAVQLARETTCDSGICRGGWLRRATPVKTSLRFDTAQRSQHFRGAGDKMLGADTKEGIEARSSSLSGVEERTFDEYRRLDVDCGGPEYAPCEQTAEGDDSRAYTRDPSNESLDGRVCGASIDSGI